MKTIAIIQARMGSTRLPGKVLKKIAGRTMLARTVARTRRARRLDLTVVATTASRRDDAIVEHCRDLDVPVFRGDEEDVLDRYHRAATKFDAGVVVRITSDCPLIDPAVVDRVVDEFRRVGADYASLFFPRTFPRGLDTEAMTSDALGRAWREAREEYQRTHVTPYIHENPDLFRLANVTGASDFSRHRWTVDTPEDLAFVRAVCERIGEREDFTWHDVLEILRAEPELERINAAVAQKKPEDC